MIRFTFAFLQGLLMALPALWYGPTHPWALGVVAALLWPLLGVLQGSFRAAVWVCLLSLIPFIHGVSEAFANPPERTLALVETGVCVALYVVLTAWAVAHRRARLSAGSARGAPTGS